MQITHLINQAFNYVVKASAAFNIDESHALKHSMQVYYIANDIYNVECIKNPFLKDQKDIICVSALLHDMCDKKYMDEVVGLNSMRDYMGHFIPEERMNTITEIISTMSYSKVKKNGFPDMGEYQMAYHIVRESDLLAAYDPDRCIIYSMMVEKKSYLESVHRCFDLFDNRVLKYIEDGLFITEAGKTIAHQLHEKAILDIRKIRDLSIPDQSYI